MYVLLVIALIIFNIVFLCDYIIEKLIIKRLREMNGGIEHPLYSKDGISGNTRNAEFQEFLEDIEGEDDPELKRLKIYNKVVSRITRIAFIITFIIVVMVAMTTNADKM